MTLRSVCLKVFDISHLINVKVWVYAPKDLKQNFHKQKLQQLLEKTTGNSRCICLEKKEKKERKWTGRWTAALSVCLGGWRWWAGCGSPPPRRTGTRRVCLLFYGPLGFPSLIIPAAKRLKSLKNIQIMTSHQLTAGLCVFLWCVELISTSAARPPCLSLHTYVCVCVFALPHMPLYDTDFPQRSCALTGKVKVGLFFLWLWKMEASFMTHVPCPPVKITPAVFQRCSIIRRAANENNGACGEETRQTKREQREKKKRGGRFLDGNTCRSTLYIYIILSLPIRLGGRACTDPHTCRNL